jgi:predicted AlkP superfamily pyrophosphatase or phosphodiesterase
VMPGIEEAPVWNSEVADQFKRLARADQASYELGGKDGSTFPHDGRVEAGPIGSEQFNVWAFDQPRVDDAVLGLTKVAIDQLQLGQREGHVDFLAVSFSALDRVGHRFGPTSQEALSTLVHVDLVVGGLLRYLDEKVGEGRWVAGLAGDHGVALNPEAARAAGDKNAERINLNERVGQMGPLLRQAATKGPNPDRIAERLAELIENNDLVEKAYTHHQLVDGGTPSDSFAVLYRNSYYPGRAWGVLSRFGVEVRYGEGDVLTPSQYGTDHGSPYWYDRHIEMDLLGAGVTHGTNDQPVYSVDFAPTLAGLVGIRVPDDLDGRRIMP